MTLAPAQFLGIMPGGFSEAWSRGNLLFVVPVVSDRYPPTLREAIGRRRSVLLAGECPCGAQSAPEDLDPRIVGEAAIVHAAGCSAPDAEQLMTEWISNRSQS